MSNSTSKPSLPYSLALIAYFFCSYLIIQGIRFYTGNNKYILSLIIFYLGGLVLFNFMLSHQSLFKTTVKAVDMNKPLGSKWNIASNGFRRVAITTVICFWLFKLSVVVIGLLFPNYSFAYLVTLPQIETPLDIISCSMVIIAAYAAINITLNRSIYNRFYITRTDIEQSLITDSPRRLKTLAFSFFMVVVVTGVLTCLPGNNQIKNSSPTLASCEGYKDKEPTLHKAILCGDAETLQTMLDAGANPNQVNEEELTPIFIAVLNNQADMINILKSAGANLEAVYKNGYKPLHFAASLKNEQLISALLEAGANPNAVDNEGMTALHHAAKSISLTSGGLSKNSIAKTILDNDLSIDRLIKSGANVNAVDNNGFTPLHVAVVNDQIFALSNLLRAGANPNIQDPKANVTPLFLAVFKEDIETTEKLIKAHAQLNIQDKEGNTVLHLAAKKGNVKILNLLLNANADPLIKNHAGQRAVDVAEKNKKVAVVTILNTI